MATRPIRRPRPRRTTRADRPPRRVFGSSVTGARARPLCETRGRVGLNEMKGLRTLCVALVACAITALAAAPASARSHAPRIQVLSNRADLVSGGDALGAGRGAGRGQGHAAAADGGAPQRLAGAEAGGQAASRGRGQAAARGADQAHRPGRATARAARLDRHQPPDRRPDLRRPADPAVDLPGRARRTRSATSRRRSSTSTCPKGAPTEGAALPGIGGNRPAPARSSRTTPRARRRRRASRRRRRPRA